MGGSRRDGTPARALQYERENLRITRCETESPSGEVSTVRRVTVQKVRLTA
jgi:hypothetical protein